MQSFIVQIEALDNVITRPTPPQIESRSVRRKKARDAAKASQPKTSRSVSNNSINQK